MPAQTHGRVRNGFHIQAPSRSVSKNLFKPPCDSNPACDRGFCCGTPIQPAGMKPQGCRRGVRRVDIPDGDDDLYVLKSSIVPPVCPKCPQRSACPRQKPCPPCPPCARCPEPAFTCKKVPNYNSMNNQYLPLPWLSQAAPL